MWDTTEELAELCHTVLAHQQKEANLRIADYILYLLLTTCGIERYCNSTNSKSAEVGEEILHTVLGKNTDILLYTDAEV